jgi:hypothetical protein
VSIHSTNDTHARNLQYNRHRVSSKHSRFSLEFHTTNYEHANDTRPSLYVPYATLPCQGQLAIDSVDTERRCVHPTAFTISVQQLILNTGQVRNGYCTLNIIQAMNPRTMRAAGYVARMGEKRDAYWAVVDKTEGDSLRPRPRWDDNIKWNLNRMKERGLIDTDRDGDKWRTLANAVMNLRLP